MGQPLSDGIVVEPAREVGEGPGRAAPLPKKVRVPRERKPRTPRPPRVKVEAGIRVRDESEAAKSWIATPEDVDEWFRSGFSWKARKAIRAALECVKGHEQSLDYTQRLKIASDMAKWVIDREYPTGGNGKKGGDINLFLQVIDAKVMEVLPLPPGKKAEALPVLEAEVLEGEAQDEPE